MTSALNFRQQISLLRLFEDYSTKENALELFLTEFLYFNGDIIQDLDETIRLNNVSIIKAWAMMNGGVSAVRQRYLEKPEAVDYVFVNLENPDRESLSHDDLELLAKFFSKPRNLGATLGAR